MSGALALMMARARFNHLALEGITYIGANVGAGTTSGGATSAKVDLPAGSQAGDWALITLNTFSADVAGLSLTSPTAAQVLAPQNYTSTSGYQYLAAYLYQLTSGDITSGSLTVTTSAVSTQTVGLEVLRASGTLMLDVAGALGKGNIAASSTGNMTAPGVSAAAGAVVFYIAGLVTGGGGNLSFGSPPVGFNLDFNAYYQSSSPQALCHRPPTAAGATGDATMTATEQRTASDWSAVLLSLKQAVPGIELTIDLPAGTVGAAYAGSITATNVGGATGAITLSGVTGIPSGLTLGTRTGSGPYVWGFDGTVTGSATTTTIAGTASNGTSAQDETFSQTFAVVAAASAGPAFVRGNSKPSTAANPSVSFLDGATATAGNLLVATMVTNVSGGPNAPGGWEKILVAASGYVLASEYRKTSDGTETGIAFIAAAASRGLTITEWSAAKLGTSTFGPTNAGSSTDAFGPSDSPVSPNAIAFVTVGWNYAPQGSATFQAPWIAPQNFVYQNNYPSFYAYQPAPNGPVSGVVNVSPPRAHFFVSLNIWIEPA